MMKELEYLAIEVEHKIEEKLHFHNQPSKMHNEKTFGEKAADKVANHMGSWHFIIIQSIIITIWLLYNAYVAVHILLTNSFDPYPFILLNLLFSTQAAYSAPIIMMSQNRSAAIDRAHAENAWHQISEVYNDLKTAIDRVQCIDEKQDEQMTILRKQNEDMIGQHEELLKELHRERSQRNS